MTEEKFNYAIVRSLFGDYWIGKTKLSVKADSIFADYDEALEAIKQYATYDEVIEMELEEGRDEIEIIEEGVEKFII